MNIEIIGMVVGMGMAIGGIGFVAATLQRAREQRARLAFLEESELAYVEEGPVEETAPLVQRLMRPMADRVTRGIRALYPSTYLDRVHQQLLHAGLATKIRAEELATLQVSGVGISVLLAVALMSTGGSVKVRLLLIAVLVVASLMGPSAWLARRVRQRTSSIEKDLPDVLDLLTIAVEAGLGLEQAMEAATADFDSAMSEELARTLQEMSLGLSRQAALNNLKQRSMSTDLGTFVLVLTQADSLGMPIGRVLRTQAEEMRERRRARAKEAAGKLPVKILFPLMAFILPPLMIVVLGPAAAQVMKIFKYL